MIEADDSGRGRRGGARVWAIVTIACALGAGVWASYPWLFGDTTVPAVERLEAERAVAEARRTGAARWSPDTLADAEVRLQAAALELRRQELRPLPRRDYAGARARFAGARARALHARSRSARLESDWKNGIGVTVARASSLVKAIRQLTASMRLSKATLRRLAEAQMRVEEARALLDAGRHEAAERSARQAEVAVRQTRDEAMVLVRRFRDADELERWRGLRAGAIAASKNGRTSVLIDKDARLLTLYVGGSAARRYAAEFGENGLERKVRQNDRATPEGAYRIATKKGLGKTRYHLALEIDYPNEDDRRRLAALKRSGAVAASAGSGALIQIHGDGGRGWDWTEGCIALANEDIEDLFKRVSVGTTVTIIGSAGDGEITRVARVLEAGADHGRAVR